jgi:hypothetical protein
MNGFLTVADSGGKISLIRILRVSNRKTMLHKLVNDNRIRHSLVGQAPT